MIKMDAFKSIHHVHLQCQNGLHWINLAGGTTNDKRNEWITVFTHDLENDNREEYVSNRNTLSEELFLRYTKLVYQRSIQMKEWFNDHLESVDLLLNERPQDEYYKNIRAAVVSSRYILSTLIDEIEQYYQLKNSDIGEATGLSFEPLRLSDSCQINELPTIFYNLRNVKLISSKENMKRILLAILRDKDGNELKKSTLDDIFNDSKPEARSKKV